MICPVCKAEMEVDREDISHNPVLRILVDQGKIELVQPN